MNTAPDEKHYGVANMTTDSHVEFQIHFSNSETTSTTRSITDTDHILNQLESAVSGIMLNEQMQFKRKLYILMIDLEVSCKATGIQELQRNIVQCVIPYGYLMMHLVTHISESI
jgi:hypothetical protein